MEGLFQLNKRHFLILLGIIVLTFFNAYSLKAEIKADTKDVTCKGKSDGEVTISVSGATGTFEYMITGKPFQGSGTFTGLSAGSYTATVRDTDTKCEYSKSFEIKEPAELTVSPSGGGTHEYCNNQNPPTVTLSASASGGTEPVTVSPPSITVSSSGTHTFTATDKNGCTATASVQVTMVPIVCSRDPNDIIGPEGVGPEKWVAKTVSQPYTIRFENDPEFATAPAQDVRINQKLDTHLNLYSLRLGDFGFGSYVFSVPPNRTYYSARLNVKDSLGVFVDVTAGIDVTKGEAFWIFKSVDPATGLPPADASLGFLLVNDSQHRGEGFVSYTVKAASNTVTGDSIYAMANIVFDINEAIVTPEIFNTIDASPPASQVNPVPAEIQGDYLFTASGSDEGSGLESFDLYISENDGDFKLLVGYIPIDSGYTFRGTAGSHYAMYSVARDRVGNIESLTTLGDVTFTVPVNAFVRLLNPLGGEEYCAADTINIRWESTDVDNIDIYYSSDNGTNYGLIASEITAADSSYLWMLPASIAEGNLYKILIRASSDSTIYDALAGLFKINKAPVPVIISSKGQTICYGDNTVLSVTPNTFATYKWSTAATTSTITAAQAGVFSVTATDNNGCSASDIIEIDMYPEINRPVIAAGGPTSFCAGDSVQLSAPTGFDGYQWSTGDTTRSIIVHNSNDLSVIVSTASECTSAASEIVSVTVHALPETPFIEAGGPLTICAGDSVRLFAPAGFAQYVWSTGETTLSITVSQGGSYTVSVTTAAGCTSEPSLSADVTVQPVPLKPVIQANGPLSFCAGGSVVLSAPFGYDHYLWSTGETTQAITVLNSGNYFVRVKMENGCISPASEEVRVNTSETLPKPTISVNGPVSFCQGGSVELSAPDGFQDYFWSTGDTTQIINVLLSGNYSVTVSMNGGNCVSPVSDAITVTVVDTLPKPVIQANGPLTFCQGDSVILSVSSGYASYVWSTGDTTQTITVSSSGNYSVSVNGSTACVVPPSDEVTVTVLAPLPKPIIEALGPLSFCTGQSVVLSAPDGYARYVWSTGDTTRIITVTAAGNYSVAVTSDQGCTSPLSDVVTVIVNAAAPKPVIQVSGPLSFCEGGSVTLSATEGYGGYIWSTGDTTRTITVSMSGNYFVTGTMSEACVSPPSDTIAVIVNPLPPKPIIHASGPLTFFEGDSVVLSTSVHYYAYLWSTGDTTQSIVVTTTADIFLTVRDSTGCQNTSDVITTTLVTDTIPPTITLPEDITVFAGLDSCGTIVTVPLPSVSDNYPGVINVTNDYNNTSNATGYYPVGTTVVTWTALDRAGNSTVDSMLVTVTDDQLPQIAAIDAVIDRTDPGSCTASVVIPLPVASDNCGLAIVTNSFNNSTDASGVYPLGTTLVTWRAVDASGNIAYDSTFVTVIDQELPTITAPANITVNTDSAGCSAFVTVPLPTATDNCGSVLITNNRANGQYANGNYPLGETIVIWKATDAAGNIATDTMIVTVIDTQPPVITAPADIIISTNARCTAQVTVPSPVRADNCSVASITNSYTHSPNASGFYALGTTIVVWTVTDASGNSAVDSMKVTVIDTKAPTLVVSGNIIKESIIGECGAHVVVPIPATSDNCQVTSLINSFNGTSNASGFYPAGTTPVIWTVTDLAGNTTVDSILVTVNEHQAPLISVPENITQHVDPNSCNAYVSIPLPTAYDNCAIASIVNDHTHSSDASGVYPAGTTTIVWTVTDVSGNTATATTVVTVIDNVAPQLVYCPADITVTASGNCSGVASWNPPTALDACGIASLTSNHSPAATFPLGITTVTYTAVDIYGNTATCSFKVTVESAPLTVSLAAKVYACGFNVSCNGATDGKITASVNGGCAPYTYVWSNGQSGPVATVGAGTYSVSITDGNGNIKTAIITLTAPQPLSSTTVLSQHNGYNVSCYGGANGTAEVKMNGGCVPYSYVWSNGQTTAKATGLSSGMYSVIITDANGCSIKNTVSLTQPTQLYISAGENKKVYYGYAQAACTTLTVARASGGTPGYSYLWSTGETTPQINVCPSTDTEYTVTIIDKNGCKATDKVKVCVEDVTCRIGRSGNGVRICVRSSFLPWLKFPLCVPAWAVQYYLNQGATLGSCNSNATCNDSPLARNADPERVIAGEDLFMEAHPNPFSKSSFITLYLPGVKSATLKIYDLDGIEVSEVFNGELEGIELREFEFIPSPHMAAGVYFYRLTTNDGRVIMKKMIFTR